MLAGLRLRLARHADLICPAQPLCLSSRRPVWDPASAGFVTRRAILLLQDPTSCANRAPKDDQSEAITPFRNRTTRVAQSLANSSSCVAMSSVRPC
jgi:hypothetical protein